MTTGPLPEPLIDALQRPLGQAPRAVWALKMTRPIILREEEIFIEELIVSLGKVVK